MNRAILVGLAAMTAVGGAAVVITKPPSPDVPPVIDLPAGVEPFIDKKIIPYEIDGTSGAELAASMAAKGPRKGLARFIAYTEWKIEWQYRFKESGGTCAIDAATLGVRVAVGQYLPHWKASEAAAEPLKSAWDKYRAALNAHEDQHARHGIDAAREILAGLLKLPAAKTCPEIEATADKLGAELQVKNKARDSALDQRTKNGLDGLPPL